MKKILLLTCLLLSSKSYALELAKYPIELSSREGVNVVIAPTTDKKQALIKITGINHEIDGITFLTDFKPHGSNNAYKYTYDGTERGLVSVGDSYGCCSYTLYIPDTLDGMYLSKKEQSDPVIVADLKAQYEQQLKQGTQAKLATFNRQKHLNYQQQKVAEANTDINKQCGLAIKTNVEWTAIDDKTLQQYAVGAFCAQVAEQMAYMCKNDQTFKTQFAQFNNIECEFGNTLKLRQNNKTLTFKTAPKAPNQGKFIEAYLLNL